MSLSFVGAVNIAVRLVTEQYPDAKLYVAIGTKAPNNQPMKHPNDVNKLEVIFEVDSGYSHVQIDSIQWGEFGPVVFKPEPWPDCIPISWPVNMDLPEAIALKINARYGEPFTSVTLRQPLQFLKGEPLYVFLVGAETVTVGVDSHLVLPVLP